MESKKVWKKIKRSKMPNDGRCVKHKWVFPWKRCGTARAHLVACGHSLIAGMDFQQVFSPVGNDVSFRITLIVMTLQSPERSPFDAVTAFPLGDLEEETHTDCPEGMDTEPDECPLLLKTIHGLVQSAHQHNKKFTETLVDKMGHIQCPSDPC